MEAVKQRVKEHVKFVERSGAANLERVLKATTRPLDAIKSFQNDHSLAMFERPRPALAFLRNLDPNSSLSSTHQTLMHSVRNQLLKKIKAASQDHLRELIALTYPFVLIPELDVIPLTVLGELRDHIQLWD